MKAWYAALAAGLIFIITLIFFPDVVYDQLLWKYFIGPIIADASGHSVSYHNVHAYEGYTVFSEVAYGATLVAFIYLLYRLFERLELIADTRFILSTLPFMLYGGVARVIEDAGILKEPLSYLFISPIIYFQIGLLFSLALYFGLKITETKKFIYTMIGNNAAFLVIYIIFLRDYSTYTLHPVAFAIFSMFVVIIYHNSKQRDYSTSIFCYGLLSLLAALYVLIIFSIDKQYFELKILLGVLTAAAITGVIYFISWKFNFNLLMNKINSLIVFGHMLDSMTTYFAVVNPFKWNITYGEKHPLPDFLMKNAYGIGYPLLKLIVVLGIIYAIDDIKPNLKNLLKFAILFLGFSPGLRDVIRILIGV